MDLKTKLQKGAVTVGSWITVSDMSVVEIMARERFDWLAIDMEHSAITLQQAQRLLQIIEPLGVTPLVRVGENSPYLIKRAMDAGAHGVIVPMVNSAQDAMKAVSAVKYPPFGKRGVGLARAQGYGLEFPRYKNWVNKKSIVVVQIEDIQAIDGLEDILRVRGVDASIIGPYDLSASLGYPGEFERKQVKKAIIRYLHICNKLRKPAGFHVISPEAKKVSDKIKEGFKFIGFSLDTLFIGNKIRSELGSLKTKK